MNKDYFSHKAESYEQDDRRVENVNNIARSIQDAIELSPSMNIMDLGSGTGLLLENIAPHVNKITAIDISSSMNAELEKKRGQIGCDLEIIEADLTKTLIDRTFDGVISSMTLHHIEDTKAIFKTLHQMLNENGFIAIADLDTEDGSFHTEDTGVFHTGFDRNALRDIVRAAGFKNVAVQFANVVEKPYGNYSVFLLTAIK